MIFPGCLKNNSKVFHLQFLQTSWYTRRFVVIVSLTLRRQQQEIGNAKNVTWEA